MYISLIVRIVFVCMLGLGSVLLEAQGLVHGEDGIEILPVDGKVRTEKLDNGFTYYVRENNVPDDVVMVYFVVKAGFLQEDDDQIGLAHVLEHVAMNGTVNFSKKVSYYLERLGMQRGSQINASTGYSGTIYNLAVPRDSVGALDLCLRIARDIGSALLLRPAVIEIERNAVIAEGLRAAGRIQRELDTVVPWLLADSFFSRRGLGTKSTDDVRKFDHSKLIRFYNDWYRPELQSIVVVGNIDADTVVQKIKEIFGGIPVSKSDRSYVDHEIYFPGKRKFLVFSDPEQKDIEIRMYSRYPSHGIKSIPDLRKSVVGLIYNSMIQNRFSEMLNRRDPPFRFANSRYMERGLVGLNGMDLLTTTILVDSVSQLETQVSEVVKELVRVERYGFSQEELELARNEVLGQVKVQATSSSDLADYCVENFLYGNHIPDINARVRLTRELIELVSLDEVNAQVNSWFKDYNFDVVLIAPEKVKDELPNQRKWNLYVKNARASSSKPYVYKSDPSLERHPTATNDTVRVFRKSHVCDITELRFGNGLTVVLKPSRTAESESDNELILMHGFSSKGAALYSSVKYFSAIASAQVVSLSGIGNLNNYQMRKLLGRNNIDLYPYVNDFSSGIKASCTSRGFELMVDVMSRYFFKPSIDRDAFIDWKSDQVRYLSDKTPDEVLLDTIKLITREGELGMTRADVDQIKAEDVEDIFHQRFGDPRDFTFVVTGDFDSESMIPVLAKYFGVIPVFSSEDKLVGGIDYARSTKECTELYGHGDSGSVAFRLLKKIEINDQNVLKLNALRWILDRNILYRLREKEKGVYSVLVNTECYRYPYERFVFSVAFKCAPDRIEDLARATIEEIDNFKKNGIDDETYKMYQDLELRKIELFQNTSRYWYNYLFFSYYNKIPLRDFFSRKEQLQNLTAEEIREFAFTYFKSDDLLRFVYRPSIDIN